MSYSDDSSRVYKRLRHAREMAKSGRCTLCPPHGKENRKRYKRGPKKARKARVG